MKAWHDVHIHNFLSSCCGDNQATVENYVKEAKRVGLTLMGFANHTWDESIELPAPSGFYKRQSMAFEMQIKTQIPQDEDIKILVGAETEYCGMYDVLGMGPEAARQLDFLLIPHTHVHMREFVMPATDDVHRARAKVAEIFAAIEGITPERAQKMAKSLSEPELEPFMDEKHCDYIQHTADFMLSSLHSLMDNETLNSLIGILPISIAHPFQPVGSYALRPDMVARISDNEYGDIYSKVAAKGVGLEINATVNCPEMLRHFAIAKECGCKFTLGSDLHATGEFEKIYRTEGATDALGLTEYDFMDFVRV